MNQAVSHNSCLFACMTSLIVDREQSQTLAAVLRLSALIASQRHMLASVRPLSQWRRLLLCPVETLFVFMLSVAGGLAFRLAQESKISAIYRKEKSVIL